MTEVARFKTVDNTEAIAVLQWACAMLAQHCSADQLDSKLAARLHDLLETLKFTPGVLLPQNAPLGLLVSMALRTDHSLGLNEDQSWLGVKVDPATRWRATVAQMSQLYEEISAQGFYRYDSDHVYAELYHKAVNPPQ